ncbi:hypothetical protein PCE1_002879 [Barthelona sp. PCE]
MNSGFFITFFLLLSLTFVLSVPMAEETLLIGSFHTDRLVFDIVSQSNSELLLPASLTSQLSVDSLSLPSGQHTFQTVQNDRTGHFDIGGGYGGIYSYNYTHGDYEVSLDLPFPKIDGKTLSLCVSEDHSTTFQFVTTGSDLYLVTYDDNDQMSHKLEGVTIDPFNCVELDNYIYFVSNRNLQKLDLSDNSISTIHTFGARIQAFGHRYDELLDRRQYFFDFVVAGRLQSIKNLNSPDPTDLGTFALPTGVCELHASRSVADGVEAVCLDGDHNKIFIVTPNGHTEHTCTGNAPFTFVYYKLPIAQRTTTPPSVFQESSVIVDYSGWFPFDLGVYYTKKYDDTFPETSSSLDIDTIAKTITFYVEEDFFGRKLQYVDFIFDFDNRAASLANDLIEVGYPSTRVYFIPEILSIQPSKLATVPDQLLNITFSAMEGSFKNTKVLFKDVGDCFSPFEIGQSVACFTPAGFGTTTEISIGFTAVDNTTQFAIPNGHSIINWQTPKIYTLSPVLFSTQPFTAVMTLRGTNFGPGIKNATVTIGNYTSISSVYKGNIHTHTVLSCVMPEGVGRDLNVSVEIEGVESNIAFTKVSYQPPLVLAVEPRQIKFNGGELTILGMNFGPTLETMSVNIGNYSCQPTEFLIPHRQFKCTLEPGVGANMDVMINVGGQSAILASTLSYDPPVVESIYPISSSTIGGSTITITGMHFGHSEHDEITVSIGQFTCFNVDRYSSTSLSCEVPPGTGSDLLVFVSVAGQQSNTSVQFSYQAPTFLNSFSVGDLITDGGARVYIEGANFGTNDIGTHSVFIDKFEATHISVESNHSMIGFTVPPGVGADLNVTVTVSGQELFIPSMFSYAEPIVTHINISSFDCEGGAIVKITGTSFPVLPSIPGVMWAYDALKVTLNFVQQDLDFSFPAFRVNVVSTTEIHCVLPPGAGTDIRLVVSYDYSGVTINGVVSSVLFTYNAPVIQNIDPLFLSTASDTEIMLSGKNFGRYDFIPLEVRLINAEYGIDLPCVDMARWGDDGLTCFVSYAVGADLTLEINVANQITTTDYTMSYMLPEITSCTPSTCTVSANNGGSCDPITITGVNFPPPKDPDGNPYDTRVYIGDKECVGTTWLFFGGLQCYPQLSVGEDLLVRIQTLNHHSLTSSIVFSYSPAPLVVGVSPSLLLFNSSNAAFTVSAQYLGEFFTLTTESGQECTDYSTTVCSSNECSFTCNFASVVGSSKLFLRAGNHKLELSRTLEILPPEISHLSKMTDIVKDELIYIHGWNFGHIDHTNSPLVTFNDEVATVLSFNDTCISIEAPVGYSKVDVKVAFDTIESNAVEVEFMAPSNIIVVASNSEVEPYFGSTIYISGDDLSSYPPHMINATVGGIPVFCHSIFDAEYKLTLKTPRISDMGPNPELILMIGGDIIHREIIESIEPSIIQVSPMKYTYTSSEEYIHVVLSAHVPIPVSFNVMQGLDPAACTVTTIATNHYKLKCDFTTFDHNLSYNVELLYKTLVVDIYELQFAEESGEHKNMLLDADFSAWYPSSCSYYLENLIGDTYLIQEEMDRSPLEGGIFVIKRDCIGVITYISGDKAFPSLDEVIIHSSVSPFFNNSVAVAKVGGYLPFEEEVTVLIGGGNEQTGVMLGDGVIGFDIVVAELSSTVVEILFDNIVAEPVSVGSSSIAPYSVSISPNAITRNEAILITFVGNLPFDDDVVFIELTDENGNVLQIEASSVSSSLVDGIVYIDDPNRVFPTLSGDSYDVVLRSIDVIIHCGSISIFSVHSVSPTFGSMSSWIPIIVEGTGFVESINPTCVFTLSDGSGSYQSIITPTILSETQLQCNVPPSKETGGVNFYLNANSHSASPNEDFIKYSDVVIESFAPHVASLDGNDFFSVVNFTGGPKDLSQFQLWLVDSLEQRFEISDVDFSFQSLYFRIPAYDTLGLDSNEKSYRVVYTFNGVEMNELPNRVFYTQPVVTTVSPLRVSPAFPIPITVDGAFFVNAKDDSFLCSFNDVISQGYFFNSTRVICRVPRSVKEFGDQVFRISFDMGQSWTNAPSVFFIQSVTESCPASVYTPSIRKERRIKQQSYRLRNIAGDASIESTGLSPFVYNDTRTIIDGDRCCTPTDENFGLCGLKFISKTNVSVVVKFPSPAYLEMIVTDWLDPCNQQPNAFSIETMQFRPDNADWSTDFDTDGEWNHISDHWTGRGTIPFDVYPRTCSSIISEQGDVSQCVDTFKNGIIVDAIRLNFTNRLQNRNRAHLMEFEAHGLFVAEAFELDGALAAIGLPEDVPKSPQYKFQMKELEPISIQTDFSVTLPSINVATLNYAGTALGDGLMVDAEVSTLLVARLDDRTYVDESKFTLDELEEYERQIELTEDSRKDYEKEMEVVSVLREYMAAPDASEPLVNGRASLDIELRAPPSAGHDYAYELFVFSQTVEVGFVVPINVLPGPPRHISVEPLSKLRYPTYFNVTINPIQISMLDASHHPADLTLGDPIEVNVTVLYLRNVDPLERLNPDFIEPVPRDVTDTILLEQLKNDSSSISNSTDFVELYPVLQSPEVGRYYFVIHSNSSSDPVTLTITVAPGLPDAIRIIYPQSTLVPNHAPFSIAPVVEIIDYLSNVVENTSLTVTIIASDEEDKLLTMSDVATRSYTALSGVASFEDMWVSAKHGTSFVLTARVDSPLLEDVTSQLLTLESCPTSKASVYDSSEFKYTCVCQHGHFLDGSVCTQCPQNTYKDVVGNDVCTTCPALKGTWGRGSIDRSNCLCIGNLLEIDDRCIQCPEGLICVNGVANGTLPSYWSKNLTSSSVYTCTNTACLGRRSDSLEPCEPYHSGPLCNICIDNSARVGKGCSPCSDKAWLDILILLVILFFAAGLIYMLIRGSKTPRSQASQYTRIGMNHAQVLFALGDFGARWPGMLKSLFGAAGAAGGGVSIPAFTCTLGLNFQRQTYVYYLLPFVMVFFLWIFYRLFGDKEERRRSKSLISPELQRAILAVLYTLYSIELKQSLQALRCVNIDGEHLLLADMSIHCDSSSYGTFRLVSWVALVGYGAGIPVLFLIFLIIDLNLSMKLPDGTIPPSKFLSGGYRKRTFFWEIVIVARKAIISILTVFLASNIDLQLIMGTGTIFVFLMLHSLCQPYNSKTTFTLELLSLYIMFATLLSGITLGADEVTTSQKNIIAWVVLIVNLVILSTVFFYYAHLQYDKWRNKRRKKKYKNGFKLLNNREESQFIELQEFKMTVNPLYERDRADDDTNDVSLGGITDEVRIKRVGPIILYFEDLKKEGMVPEGMAEDLLEDIKITFVTERLGFVDICIEFINVLMEPQEYTYSIRELKAVSNMDEIIDLDMVELLSKPFYRYINNNFNKPIRGRK